MDVQWKVFAVGADVPVSSGQTTFFHTQWEDLPGNEASVVATVVEDFFGHDRATWRELFGEDWDGAVEVNVVEPPRISGRWSASVRLKVECTLVEKGE